MCIIAVSAFRDKATPVGVVVVVGAGSRSSNSGGDKNIRLRCCKNIEKQRSKQLMPFPE